MSFMQKQIEYGAWIEIDGKGGVEAIPLDLIGKSDCYEKDRYDIFTVYDEQKLFDLCADYRQCDEFYSVDIRMGYGARLSAPGYTDCTEWSVFDDEDEADDYLSELAGDE